jgi:hypothetical protein
LLSPEWVIARLCSVCGSVVHPLGSWRYVCVSSLVFSIGSSD